MHGGPDPTPTPCVDLLGHVFVALFFGGADFSVGSDCGLDFGCGSDPVCDMHCACLIFMIDAQIRIFVGLENGKDNLGAACVEPHAFLFNVIVVVLRPLVGVGDIPWLVLVGNNLVYWLNSPRGNAPTLQTEFQKTCLGHTCQPRSVCGLSFGMGGEQS